MMWRMVHLAGAFYGFVAIVYCLILALSLDKDRGNRKNDYWICVFVTVLALSQFGFAVELLLNGSR